MIIAMSGGRGDAWPLKSCRYDKCVARHEEQSPDDEFVEDADDDASRDDDPLPQDQQGEDAPLEAETARCPACNKYIWAYAIRCPKCGVQFNGEAWQQEIAGGARRGSFALWIVITAVLAIPLVIFMGVKCGLLRWRW